MQVAGIFILLEICLLSMDFENFRRRDSCAVDVHDVQVRRPRSLTWCLGSCATGRLGNCEVPDRGEGRGPGGAEDLLFIAVEVAETRWVRDGGQEGYGFLAAHQFGSVAGNRIASLVISKH
jgi:hypothetical protein